ncbi:FtsB family cell division protein [Minwuia thermotolerans]|uniref:Septation ring formation regulator EzrA n=1 Tax=Minwuia thermotolerans TaxID=2056226 RepID=A0A2M9G6X9_9PROT|nr:septum formation initiator family protein [Minwuia thermotolerans]PJK31426.1 septation ring formation regulator EzrA [Minwuia thermotolerans]
MTLSTAGSRHLLKFAPPLIGAALVFYFGFHAAYGERGLVALRKLEAEAGHQQERLEDLQARQERLRRRVELIRGPEIDGDILEEQARRILGWSRPDEVVILHPGPSASGR